MAIGMACVAVATFSFRWLSLTDLTNDHFDHVARASQILLGDWPVRDFADPGLPLTDLLSAGVQAAVGNPFLAEALLFASGFAIAAALSFRAAMLASGSAVLALLVVVLQVGAYPRTYSYPKLLVYALAVTVAWWAVDRSPGVRGDRSADPPPDPSARRLAALAAVTAVAYYFRHDHGVYVGVSALVLLSVHLWQRGGQRGGQRGEQRGEQRGVRRIARVCGLYMALTLAFVLPHLAYVQWASGLRSYFAVGLAYSRTEAGLNPFQVPAFAWPGTPEQSAAFLFWACWLIPVVAAAVLARGRVVTPLRNQTATIAMVIALAVCVDAAIMRNPLLVRLPDVAVPHTILGAWLLAALWRWPARRTARVVVRGALAASVVVMAAAVWSAFETSDRIARTRVWQGPGAMVQRWRAVTADLHEDFPSIMSSAVEPLAEFFDYLRQCTSANDRLLYVGYEPEVYVLARRGFAGGQMMFFSGFHSTPEDQAVTVRRLEAQQVPFVLVPSALRDGFRQTFTHVWSYLQTRYVRMTAIETDAGPIEILIDASRGAPPVTDQSRDWPCLIRAPRQ